MGDYEQTAGEQVNGAPLFRRKVGASREYLAFKSSGTGMWVVTDDANDIPHNVGSLRFKGGNSGPSGGGEVHLRDWVNASETLKASSTLPSRRPSFDAESMLMRQQQQGSSVAGDRKWKVSHMGDEKGLHMYTFTFTHITCV